MPEGTEPKVKVVVLRLQPFVTLLSENSGKHLRSRPAGRLFFLLIEPTDGSEEKLLVVSDINPHGTQALFYVLKHEPWLLKPADGPDQSFLELYRKYAYELEQFMEKYGPRVLGGGFCTDEGATIELDQAWMTFNFKKTTPVEYRPAIRAALPDAVRLLLSDEDIDITLH